MRKNILMNITQVSIDTYSEYNPTDPGRANITVVETPVGLESPSTVFSILKNVKLKEMNYDNMEEVEKQEMMIYDSIFLVNRAGFSINRIEVRTDYISLLTYTEFITSVFCQHKTIKMTNMFIQVQGGIYKNRMVGSNLLVENVTADTYLTSYGFIYITECNFPEAIKENELFFNNFYAYNSITRKFRLTKNFITNMGNANMTIRNSNFQIFGDIINMYSVISLRTNPMCAPQDDLNQKLVIEGNKFSLKDNPYKTLFMNIITDIQAGSTRHYSVLVKDNVFEDINHSYLPMFTFTGIGSDEYSIINNMFRNVSFLTGLISTEKIGYVNVKNLTLIDSTNSGEFLFSSLDPLVLNLEDVTIRNVSSYLDNNWIVANLNMGIVNVKRLIMSNCNINTNPAFLLEGETNKLTVVDSNFNTLKVHKNGAIFQIGRIATFEFENCNFTEIHGYNAESVNNYMIDLRAIGLESSELSYIKNSFVSQCSIGCLQINTLLETEAPSKSFELDNIKFSDCYFESEINMILIGKILTTEEFNFTMKSLTFDNMIFKNRGSLMMFRQLLAQPIIVENMKVTNIRGGCISIRPFNTLKKELKTRVLLKNLVADKINTASSS